MNPTISQKFIDRELEKDPEAGRAEWLGLFREDVSAAFPLEAIERCIVPGRVELSPALDDNQYFGFIDPSGGRHDAFTLAIAHHHPEQDSVILDAIRAVRPPFDPSDVVKQYSNFFKSYGLSSVVGDNYGGEWPKSEFSKQGISYELAENTKSELYLALVPTICSRNIELLDNEKLKTEFRRLERRTNRSGKESIDHPPRGSDDIANAVAGVTWLAAQNSGMFMMPAAYGNRVCTDQNFFSEGLGAMPTPGEFW
jgi:hypothetical protein